MVPDVEFLEDFCWFLYVFGRVLEIRILHVFSTYQTRIGPVPNPYLVLGPYFGVKGPWISVPNYVQFPDLARISNIYDFDWFGEFLGVQPAISAF